MFVAVKTSTRKRVDGRKRVSKPKNLIKVPQTLRGISDTSKNITSSFFKSYQAVAVFMTGLGILVGLSSFGNAGPIGESVIIYLHGRLAMVYIYFLYF